MANNKLSDPRLNLSRHASWLQFNERVLEEARDPANPLLERVKFLVIRALPRLVRLPSPEGKVEYVFLHDVVHAFAERLYHGYEVLSAAAFRVTRNSNLYLEEEESRTILDTVDTQLHRRRKGATVRLEIEAGADQEIIDRLQANLRLAPWQIFRVNGPIYFARVFNHYDETPRPDLKFAPFQPREVAMKPRALSIFETIHKGDLLLHHPFDSYSTVVRFIESAAQDPDVLSIKQTLYRVIENSPIVRAPVDAAAKKEVAVVVELTARFDEASTIRGARSLQEAGVQVYYGVVGLKAHCNLALVAWRESDWQIRRYAHLGTGNYNPSTARLQTDLSLLTSDARITAVHGVREVVLFPRAGRCGGRTMRRVIEARFKPQTEAHAVLIAEEEGRERRVAA